MRSNHDLRRLTWCLVGCAICLSCTDQPPQQSRDISFLPQTKIGPHSGDTRPLQSEADTVPCLRQFPARVVARGRIHKEVHLGPPGYGETPDEDRRDTILVLVLPRVMPVCGGPERGDSTAIIRTDSLQLVYPPRDALDHVGDTVTVFGGLEEAIWGWHYKKVVLHVDSIPALRILRQRRRLTSA